MDIMHDHHTMIDNYDDGSHVHKYDWTGCGPSPLLPFTSVSIYHFHGPQGLGLII